MSPFSLLWNFYLYHRRSRSKEGIPVNNPSGPDSSRHGSGSHKVKKSTLIEEETSAEGRVRLRGGGGIQSVGIITANIPGP